MRVAFVCGPYRSSSPSQFDLNIKAARDAALMLWSNGIATICPHTNSAHFNDTGQVNEDYFLRGYLCILRRCDYVLLLPGWNKSQGAIRECKTAIRRGIPVFKEIAELVKHDIED